MGFKAWRNLGVLALAGASLVGCTSGTAQKDTKVVAPMPPNNAYNVPANQTPMPNRDVFNTQQQPQFPTNNNPAFQQRPVTPAGQQTSGMPNPNAPYNPQFGGPSTSVGSSYQAPGIQMPSNSGNNVYTTTQPNNAMPQPGSGSFQPSNGMGVGNMPSQPVGAMNSTPPLPNPPLAPSNPGFNPLPAPNEFGTRP